MFWKNRPTRIFSLCNLIAQEFSTFKSLPLVGSISLLAEREKQTHKRCFSSKNIILESEFGPVSVPDINLPQYLWKDMSKWGKKPMVTCGITGRSYTYEEGNILRLKFANALLSQLQLKKGDVIGLLLPNLPEYVIILHGALEIGIIVTFVNPLYTSEEIYRQFENADVKCCVTMPDFIPSIERIIPRLKNYKSTILINPKSEQLSNPHVFDFDKLTSAETSINLTGNEPQPKDTALLPYSSGTTGLPKGVMLTHRNLVSNLMQILNPKLCSYEPTTDEYQEVALSVLPFFHIYGLNAILNVSIKEGFHIVTIPKFTPESYLDCLLKYKPTQLFLVPSLLLFLNSHPTIKPEYLISVKEIVSGAASATNSLIHNFKNKFNFTDIRIRQGYGMTELSPCALLTPIEMKLGKDGSAGKLISGTQARVVNISTGVDQPVYESGELLIRGPQIMKGYWKNEKATLETIDSDGWLHTGDVAYYDEDEYFYIIDRTKELIKVKGNQVSPTELENIILKLPEVADVAVVGIPDALSDEIPKAFVVLKAGKKISENAIIQHVNKEVVHYKRLAGGVNFIDSIPRNTAGKILRKELKVLSEQKFKN